MQSNRLYIWFIVFICVMGFILALPNAISDERLAKLPDWFPKHKITLGLDLQGGSHLLLEVKTSDVIAEQLNNMLDGVRSTLRTQDIGYTDLSAGDGAIQFTLRDLAQKDAVYEALRKEYGQDAVVDIKADGKGSITLREEYVASRKKLAVEQSIEVVRRRVDETGTREPTIIRQGEDRILVQLPGEGDPERLKRLLGKTAKLTFQLVDMSTSVDEARMGRTPPGSQLLPADKKDGYASDYVVKRQVIISGDMLVDAQPSYQENQPVVSFRFDSRGSKKFGEVTSENIGKPFAIILDGKVISAPVIRSAIIGGSGIISGSFTTESAKDLALLLRAGALPAPLTVLEERSVGAELGRDSVEAGTMASIMGFALVSLCMVLCYSLFGVFAVISLTVNLALLAAALSLLGATLTLPGIAGVVLSIGMSVDANVLIFERIREELRLGRGPRAAVDNGFKHAVGTITDANLTALIANFFLYLFGTGPVRGFAVTLSIGLLASMFTAITLTRLIVQAWMNRVRPQALPL
ncbi:MAG: protein translocase subunit SecD [Alphaproteobacteria bacterium]|nr:MAG: protein translocase subunit SecD [Alphaproteobacteria bacterium]